MKKRKATKSIITTTGIALVAGAAVYLLGGKNSQTVQADSGATTETVAAGAR